ncbi:hypothetical protein P22_0798 [Propionispora sp. 2/2-37]|uniref:IclR family transcriptional regulator n=1 Tax=Propionispora sp. 2/2-37 TaxID=1677858 RepID=UPI0006BB64ED|nr:IclR family transcriptional regulator [Propionispora sp. 2/2-37]CUH94732.1 hypothetical protein P22_0798 [Propionispora sp. 2/2-37]
MKTIQSIDRAMLILNYISKHNGNCTLTDIGNELELKLPTLHGILATLEHWNIINKQENKYTLGGKLFELGKIFEAGLSIQKLLHPYLEQLAAEFGETIYLAIPSNHRLLYIDEVVSKHPLRLTSIVGSTEEFGSSGIGMVVLANLPQTEWDEAASQAGIDAAVMRERLISIRQQGYFVHRKQNCDCYCIAISLENIYNTAVGMSTFIPAYRFTEELARKVTDRMRIIKQNIKADLK